MRIKILKEGALLSIKVVPKSNCTEIVGWEGEELKVRIHALPEKNRANEELIRFLSKTLKIPKSSITLIQGETSRHKKVLLHSLDKRMTELLESL